MRFLQVYTTGARQGATARNSGGVRSVEFRRSLRTGNDGGGYLWRGARAVDMVGEPVKDYLIEAR